MTRRCPSLTASDSNWVRLWRHLLPMPPCQCVCVCVCAHLSVYLLSRFTVKMDAQMKCPPPAVVQQMKSPQHFDRERECVCVQARRPSQRRSLQCVRKIDLRCVRVTVSRLGGGHRGFVCVYMHVLICGLSSHCYSCSS